MRKNFMKRKMNRFIFKIGIGTFILIISCVLGIYFISFLLGPPELTNEQNTVYYSNNGEIIGEEQGTENRHWIDLEDMSEEFIHATLLIEDQHFYNHIGFDFRRITRAVLRNIQSMSLKEGASTVTQQYARNLFLSHDKTWSRKLKEAFYTIRLEMFYSKDEILEGYLNTIYFGHGAYGIETASDHFFHKSAKELSLAESAMLAAIPNGPTYFSPLNNETNATNRQNQILGLMHAEDLISEQDYQAATEEVLVYSEQTERNTDSIGPHFQDTVLKEAAAILELDAEFIRSGGFQIHTTLDVDQQNHLENQIQSEMDTDSDIEIGAMAMNPDTGAIQALAGGKAYESSSFNRAIDAKRMPASTFKPFLYYAALHHGYTPSTMLTSKPTEFVLEDGEVYQPSNFNDNYANEPITLAQALALSDNVYAVKTNMFLGAQTLVDTAREFGFTSDLPAVPSLALGTATVSVEEMVKGYGMLANGGHEISSHTIDKIMDRDGEIVFEKDNEENEPVLDPQKAFILTHLLTGMFDSELDGYMPVTGSPIVDDLTRTYAGKSGTTNSDSWMIGYSPSLVTGVWTGYDDNRNMEIVAESAYARSIWSAFMEATHEGMEQESFHIPSGVVGVPIDPETGHRATPDCNSSRVMYFEVGTEPQSFCSEHHHENQENEDERGIFEQWFELFY
ncbi:1A family penicillin-binding protein [Virgibacillus natechei]|uniref:1A family penicillin-binding protein n=1 Tax=Virgibacillus natechei TaxID=1216297 RepID=A0ABS4IFX8_9BACI|nr:transglycosylase domain-containing protein [Virgibacillus natechei]MBP1969828.1 1A family penicillin-binding protein [Virgibacillus natechei]UZD12640.1 penicillin-binding protein [Virgibacillus natechei]